MASKPSSKPAASKPASKTQTYPSYQAAIAGAIKRGESSITFKLPASKPKAK